MLDVAIIGGGPAGLSAGLYASRMGLKTKIFEKFATGGQIALSSEIENYPGVCEVKSGFELMECWPQQVKKFGCEIENIEITKLQKNETYFILNNDIKAKAVIIATGSSPKRAGFENEEKFIGRGVSTCAVCDGFFYKGKDVAVIGGGDTALEEAIYLSSIVNKVYLIHRRDKFRASPTTIKRVLNNKKIEILYNSIIEKVEGEQFLNSIYLDKEGEKRELKVSGVFVFVGNIKNTDILKNENGSFLCEISEDGSVKVDLNMKTSVEGLFAVGDIRKDSKKQVVCAAADGAVAALEVVKYIDEMENNL